MINNEVIENELHDLRNEIYDLFLRVNQLKNEVHKMNIQNNKVIYEQHKTKVENYIIKKGYSIKSRLNRPCKCLNYVNRKNRYLTKTVFYYSLIGNDDLIPISSETSLIIETYIPSKNLVLVVEL